MQVILNTGLAAITLFVRESDNGLQTKVTSMWAQTSLTTMPG